VWSSHHRLWKQLSNRWLASDDDVIATWHAFVFILLLTLGFNPHQIICAIAGICCARVAHSTKVPTPMVCVRAWSEPADPRPACRANSVSAAGVAGDCAWMVSLPRWPPESPSFIIHDSGRSNFVFAGVACGEVVNAFWPNGGSGNYVRRWSNQRQRLLTRRLSAKRHSRLYAPASVDAGLVFIVPRNPYKNPGPHPSRYARQGSHDVPGLPLEIFRAMGGRAQGSFLRISK